MFPAHGYRAVVFDFFGTLTEAVQRGPGHDRVAALLGCTTAAFADALNATFLDRSTGSFGDPIEALDAVVRLAGGHSTIAGLQAAYAARVDAVGRDTRLRSDAVPVLWSLRRLGLRTAVVSDCTPELAVIWPELPVAGLVDARVLSIEERRHKPHPWMYMTAAARLGVPPAACLYVGDGGSHELTGAEAAGMTPIRLAATDLHRHLVFQPDPWDGRQIPTLSDVLDLVRPSIPAQRRDSMPAVSVHAVSVPAVSVPAVSVPAPAP
jgi:putative hydrolase of the HAD superfamily